MTKRKLYIYLEEGNLLIISDSNDSICMKKIELPKIKSWKEATKPFREAAKKSNFSNEDLKKLIIESCKEVKKNNQTK